MPKTILIFSNLLFFITTVFSQSDYQNHLALAAEADYFESQQYMIGKPIFEFSAKTIDGNQLNSEDFKGKVMVINLWFMACPPCIAELNDLNEIVEKYENNDFIEFLSFTRDSEADLAKEFFPNHDFKFQIVPDAETFIMEKIRHRWGFPTTFVVDKRGRIQKIVSGNIAKDKTAIVQIIEACLME